MSKLQYASVLAVLATIMIVFIVYMGRNTKERYINIKRQLYLIFMMDMLYFVSFFSNEPVWLTINHCLVQVLEILSAYMFFAFVIRYSDDGVNDAKVIRVIMGLLVLTDSAMLVVNAFSKSFFDFRIVKNGSDVYAEPIVNNWYIVHLFITLFMLCVFVYIIVKKMMAVSQKYRAKYLILSISFGIGIVICAIVRALGYYINFPSVILMTIGVCVVFYLFYFVPKIKYEKMKNFAIRNVTSPIFMFDEEDRLEFVNEPANALMSVELGMPLEEFIADNNLRYILAPERRKSGKTKEFTLTLEYKSINYFLHGQELWDEKGNFVGTLLIYSDISKQEKLKDEATYHATRDALTGLWNREFFLEMVDRTLYDYPDREFVMVVSDIAQFKMFNDILGGRMGDDLILTIANALKSSERNLWITSRVGGDRFAVLIPKEDFDGDRFVNTCHSVINERQYGLSVHFYLGVYFIKDHLLKADDIYDRAFMALESIKGKMDRTIAYYDEAIREKKLHDTLNVDELERALAEKRFEIYLQPQINASNNTIVGCEALVRWINPKRGLVPPNEFIPAFEANELIAKLDYYVWELACKLLKKWKEQGYAERSISVNISAKDFYLSDIEKSFVGLVEKYDISPKNLKLEITESAFVLNVKEQMALVRKLQKFGFIIEIDDFGSGYSSLNSLKDIYADVLKLDLKFFEKTDDTKRAEKIIESIISLAYKLKMPVIAEGVEEKEQLDMLSRNGCNLIQGFYYAKPMPVEEYEKFVSKYECEDIQDMIMKLKRSND